MGIKNKEAYFAQAVRNADKNGFRANDRQAKHITVDSSLVEQARRTYDDNCILEEIADYSPENWLMTIENPQLLKGLQMLKPKDLEFIYLMAKNDWTTYQMAEYQMRDQAAVSRTFIRIKTFLKKFL